MARTLTLQAKTRDPFDTGWLGRISTAWTGVNLQLTLVGAGRRQIQLTRQIAGTTLQLFSEDVAWTEDDVKTIPLGNFTGQIRMTAGLAAESDTASIQADVVCSGDISPWDASLAIDYLADSALGVFPSPGSTLTTPSGDVVVQGAVISSPTVGAENTNRVALFGNSIGIASYFPKWSTATSGPWLPSSGIALNAVVHPMSIDLRNGVPLVVFRCTVNGTTGTVEPSWPTTAGSTVTDGTVVWTAVLDDADIYQSAGGWNIAQSLSGQKFDEVFLVGAYGLSSPSILAYRDRAIAAQPNIMVYLHMWENDVLYATDLATVIARVEAFEAAVDDDIKNGRRVILGTCLPMSTIDSTSSFNGYTSGTRTQMWHYVNQSMRKFAKKSGVYLADFSAGYIDPNWGNPLWPDNAKTFVTGSGTQKYTADGLHPRLAGHWVIAKELAKTLRAMPGSEHTFSVSATGYALALNPLRYGTSGAGGNMTGSFADKSAWFCALTGAVGSLVARADGISGWWQRVVASFAGTSMLSCIPSEYIPVTAENVSVPLQAFLEVKVAANPTRLQQIFTSITAPGRTKAGYSWATQATDLQIGQFLTEDTTLLLKTVPRLFPSDTSTLSMTPRVEVVGVGGYDVSLGRSEIRPSAQ